MSVAPSSPARAVRVPSLRRRLEATGWRTWLTYRENHHRDDAGRLVRIETIWVAEAEHLDGRVATCEAPSSTQAWLGLLDATRRSDRHRMAVLDRPLLAG